MPFSPHHAFQNRLRLENLVNKLLSTGNIPEIDHSNFNRYHSAMIHKLKSAKYHLDVLQETLTTKDLLVLGGQTGDFMFEVNMNIDGYFYNAGSSMDILARVVLTMFGQSLPDWVQFKTAHKMIQDARTGDPILARLVDPSWRQEFSEYRNTLTHELTLASKRVIEIDDTGSQTPASARVPLPNDPRAVPADRIYGRNPNALEYMEKNFKRILTLGNGVSGDIASRAKDQGRLPI